MKCKKCGQEVDKKAVACAGCGWKVKKPIYKKWWFWGIIVIAVAIIATASGSDDSVTKMNQTESQQVEEGTKTNQTESKQAEEIVYEVVDLQAMFDALSGNAMKTEKEYQKKHVEFECKIRSFDSDGSYITVEPVGASEWNFTTAMCYIKSDAQKDFLIEKNVGDAITIKGKVKSIGEVMGYSIDINEVS